MLSRYEVVLDKGRLDFEDVRGIFSAVFLFLKQGEVARFSARLDGAFIRFYLETETRAPHDSLPAALPGLEGVAIRPGKDMKKEFPRTLPYLAFQDGKTLAEIFSKFLDVECLEITGRKIGNWGIFSETLYKATERYLFLVVDFHNLVIDFQKSPNFLYTEREKYLKLEKSLQFFGSDDKNSVVKVDTYPYFPGDYFLPLSNFDFMCHSLVVGATGSGKTKFLSSFIEQVNKKGFCRVVVIDPHDALKDDIGGLPETKVFDFETAERSLNLFDATAKDAVVSTDVTLSLIKSMIGAQYNSKLERLARSSIYLLIEKGEFSFKNLRKIVTDPPYRNETLRALSGYLPESIENFFGQDFNELRTGSYNEAFAPLISFIDELQLLPIFYRDFQSDLKYELFENKTTIFSLNQNKLGKDAQKVISGLILSQLFVLMQQKPFDEHVIIVIDEVAVIENPILVRFLSEARKFNVSVVLASQYFAQISESLKQSIFANTSNYFCFRVSYDDARLLSDQLNMEMSEERLEEKYELLSTLPTRKVCLRLSKNGRLGTAFLGKTLDFVPKPEKRFVIDTAVRTRESPAEKMKIKLVKSKANIFELMKENSTSRRRVNG